MDAHAERVDPLGRLRQNEDDHAMRFEEPDDVRYRAGLFKEGLAGQPGGLDGAGASDLVR